ncbi:MAG: hypothetical protein PVF34_09100 [Gammaproteobacteria bacterium]
MNHKSSLLLIVITWLMLSAASWVYAETDDFERVFTQKYKNEMLPELRLAKIDRYKSQGLTESQIKRELDALANTAAQCQFKTFQAYENKYRQVAFDALLNGGTTEDASLQLYDALQTDVAQGKINTTEMSHRIKTAQDLYTACVVNSGLVDQ